MTVLDVFAFLTLTGDQEHSYQTVQAASTSGVDRCYMMLTFVLRKKHLFFLPMIQTLKKISQRDGGWQCEHKKLPKPLHL